MKLGPVAMSAPAPNDAEPPAPTVTRTLTAKQETIVAQIRALHAARQPLNIVAVKRRHPDLMVSVYALKPYWGWKQALADAGLTYDDINTELLNCCRCQICGYETGMLMPHLRYKHEMTGKEYRKEFPGAELTSEQCRAAQHRSHATMPDWERIWTWEYACDRAMDFHRRGWALNVRAVAGRGAIRGHDAGLHVFVVSSGRQWDDVLRTIGLDPLVIRHHAKAEHLTEGDVIQRLQQRKRDGLSVAVGRLVKEDQPLADAARRLFGNHDKALRAAQIDPTDERLQRRPWTKAEGRELERSLRRLANMTGEDRRIESKRIKTKWSSLVFYHHGTWPKLCEKLAVPYAVLNHRRYLMADEVLAALHRHWQAGLTLDEIRRRDGALYSSARKLCGSWAQAVVMAARKYGGFDPARVKAGTNVGFYRATVQEPSSRTPGIKA